MNNKLIKIKNSGQVLLFVVVVMTVALSVGVSVSTRTLASLSRVTKEDTANKATAAAESGIEQLLVLSEADLQALVGQTKSYQFYDDVNNIDTKADIKIEPDASNYENGGYKFNLNTRYTKEIKLEGYTGQSIKVCWDNKNSALAYVLYDQNGVASKDLVNPSGVNLANTKGASEATAEGSYAGCITKSGIDSTYYGIRIKILYDDSNIYVFPESGKDLPQQGYKFTSVGSLMSEGKVITTKTVTATKSYSFTPGIFDEAIYTESTLYD